ncbi:hypothetical protein EC396_03115 [Lutibacter sp. HS1-25]|uniref:glycoside hydrolase family 78 protein n=1 Tax=Lutibacter sp. HS1-25 TaxID=2485000 RepID=UPI0010133353|nr:hypothetical protein [Lutibacter sp. HS1-25]RXP62722.1 hypothetical protein EC396_03115 [Lutibacter sp. HS1-25]
MKKYIAGFLMSFMLCSCGGGGSDDTPPQPDEKLNTEPSTPLLLEPTNNKLCIDNTVAFKWDVATDPEKDKITYQIQISKDNQFTKIEETSSTESTTKSIALEKGVAYYWRVKAVDSKNLSGNYSSTYSFYTEGTGTVNHIPFSPELIAPITSSVIKTATTTLEWNASDVDVNDVLTYDVYLGTENPPTTKVLENQSAKTYNATLEASKNYYWKVVVKDGKGGVTVGQVWNFKTD